MPHSLRPYQANALNWAATRDRIPIFMQMRLGKTLVAIRRAKMSPGATLVICPISTMQSWIDELGREGIACTPLLGSTQRKQKIFTACSNWSYIQEGYLPHGWFLINPEGVRAWPGILRSVEWKWTIIDESPVIKNPKAKITKIVLSNCTSPQRMILTGMPAPEGIEDYVTQMLFLFGEFMECKNFWAWRAKYMVPGMYKWEVPPLIRNQVRDTVAALSYTLTAEQAGIKLPRVYETRVVPLPLSVRRIYNQIVKEYRLGETTTTWTLVVQSWLSQLASGIVPRSYQENKEFVSRHKVKEIVYLLQTELAHSRVVIFSRFTREIRLLAHAIPGARTITGDTPIAERFKIVQHFQSGKLPVLIMQEQDVGEKGLNLSRADVLMFSSNVWSHETRTQCEARADQVDKKVPTLILDIVAENTLDEAVVDVLKEKSVNEKHFTDMVRKQALKKGYISRD